MIFCRDVSGSSIQFYHRLQTCPSLTQYNLSSFFFFIMKNLKACKCIIYDKMTWNKSALMFSNQFPKRDFHQLSAYDQFHDYVTQTNQVLNPQDFLASVLTSGMKIDKCLANASQVLTIIDYGQHLLDYLISYNLLVSLIKQSKKTISLFFFFF